MIFGTHQIAADASNLDFYRLQSHISIFLWIFLNKLQIFYSTANIFNLNRHL